ncbi:MAG TPA: MlaD family protein [Gemmatimonadaceae bacterium]|nr:MlaD family protein [Gemmatimonadaceae bacterium]
MKRSSFITWDQLKVGLVIIAALAVMTVAVYKLGKAANLFAKRYELITYLPNANGLRVGGTVFVAGQLAGSITSIEFLPPDNDTTRNLRVRMHIDEQLREQVRRDSRVKARTLGLLGDKVLDISIGSPKFPVLQPGDTVTVTQALDYEAILAQASLAVADMVDLTRDLKRITGGIANGEGTVGQLVTNRRLYDEFVGTMNRANLMLARFQNPNGTLSKLLDDPALYNRFVSVVTSADSLVISLNDKNGTIGKLLRDDTLYTRIVGMAIAGDSLMKMLSNGQGMAGRLLNDPTLYDKLNKLTTDLGAILEDVQKDPHKYFRGVICVIRCK